MPMPVYRGAPNGNKERVDELINEDKYNMHEYLRLSIKSTKALKLMFGQPRIRRLGF